MKRRKKKSFSFIILTICGVGFFFYVRYIYEFLSPVAPIDAPAVIVEGWISDAALEIASDHITRRNYSIIIVTGSPLDHGSFLTKYKSLAEVGRATIEKFTGRKDIIAVPCPPMRKDRTFASALSVKSWLDENGITVTRFNLISSAAHTRRSWYLFKVALGENRSVGALAMPPQTYDANRWWAYSEGFKSVTAETLAYLYSIIVFPFTNERLDTVSHPKSGSDV